jgi:hypothetical protein
MNKKPRLGPDSPLVQEALAGIYKSGRKIFFRINPDGQHQKISVSKALNVLDIPYENKVSLIRTFPFPELAYSSQRMQVNAAATAKRMAREVEEDDDEFEDLADLPEDELEEDSLTTIVVTVPKVKKNQRQHYQLVQQNQYWGCFNAEEVTVVLFRTRKEAELHIHRLQNHREVYKAFYSSGNNSNRHNEY